MKLEEPQIHLLLLFQDDKAGFELEALNVSKKFQDIRDEMVLQYGYDRFETKQGGGNSTQEEFTAKTLKQCDSKSETPDIKFKGFRQETRRINPQIRENNRFKCRH